MDVTFTSCSEKSAAGQTAQGPVLQDVERVPLVDVEMTSGPEGYPPQKIGQRATGCEASVFRLVALIEKLVCSKVTFRIRFIDWPNRCVI